MVSLGQIHGQERAVSLLRRALSTAKVPHAYLFSGPEGTGKRTTAIALAAAMNCERAPDEGCGACASCERIGSGLHPDFLTLEPSGAGNFIVVGEVRDLVSRLGFAPHEGRARVVVVEQADRLKQEAANAFLKALEEPPARTHFLLITAAPDQLLVTVRSRCQRVRFAPLATDAVAAILERAGVPAARARAAAALSGGSAARAAELAEGEALEHRRERAQRIRAAARASGYAPVFEVASEAAAEKEDLQPTLDLLALWYRDAAAVAAGVDPESLIHRDRARELGEEAAAARGPAALARRGDAVLAAKHALLGFASAQLTLERMILTLREG